MRIKWLSLIRILGLVFVLLYHFLIDFFPGGFLGVDLFFTLSGYLTTALFIDEYTEKQKLDLLGFARRKLYRIFPPLVLTILIVLPLTLLIRSDFRANIGQQVSAALGFMTNIFEILAGSNYENQFSPHLFLHTWTLAIEVQFYLLWGLAIWGMTRIAKTSGQLRGMIFMASSAIFLTSFLSMFVSSFFVDNFSTIYFSSWTHIFPFFLGSFLATITGIQQTTKAFQRVLNQWSLIKTVLVFLAGMGVEILLLFFFQFDSIWTYLFGFLLSSLATGTMIYAARVLHDKTETVTEPGFFLYISNISYGLYLFHWPFYIIFTQFVTNTYAILATLFFSIILSTLSFYVIEPNLAGRSGKLFGLELDIKPYAKWLTGLTALFVLAGLAISFTAPKLGTFEGESLVSNLYQADTQMATTRAAAENAQATGYTIQDGTTIFGDSVTVRANAALQSLLPEAQVDGTVSRHLTEIAELIKLYKTNNTLRKNVVVALGTNTSENYQELLDELVATFPKGHRLIFVTPYDGNFAPNQSLAYQTGQYEKSLAEKYDYISIADWYQVSVDNPQIWVNSDLVHFNLDTEGATLFAQTIKDALAALAEGPVKE